MSIVYKNNQVIVYTKSKAYKYSPKKYGPLLEKVVSLSYSLNKKINNYFEINDDIVNIYYYSKRFGIQKIIIDIEDLDKVSKLFWSTDIYGKNKFYALNCKNKKKIKLHRFILDIYDPNIIIDHKNGNGLDCRRCNLRIVDCETNSRNRLLNTNNKTGIKGVCYIKNINSYVASICIGSGKQINKAFSIKKYGENVARTKAINWREKQEKNIII